MRLQDMPWVRDLRKRVKKRGVYGWKEVYTNLKSVPLITAERAQRLDGAFVWVDTEQGHMYWLGLYYTHYSREFN